MLRMQPPTRYYIAKCPAGPSGGLDLYYSDSEKGLFDDDSEKSDSDSSDEDTEEKDVTEEGDMNEGVRWSLERWRLERRRLER